MRPVKEPVLYEDLTYRVIGCAMRVHRELGSIHKESVYQKALGQEFEKEKMKYEREVDLPVVYDGKKVGVYRPDFVVESKIILELKAMEFIPKNADVQLSYYLKSTGYKIGLLMNFGAKSLEIRRRIYG